MNYFAMRDDRNFTAGLGGQLDVLPGFSKQVATVTHDGVAYKIWRTNSGTFAAHSGVPPLIYKVVQPPVAG